MLVTLGPAQDNRTHRRQSRRLARKRGSELGRSRCGCDRNVASTSNGADSSLARPARLTLGLRSSRLDRYLLAANARGPSDRTSGGSLSCLGRVGDNGGDGGVGRLARDGGGSRACARYVDRLAKGRYKHTRNT